MKNVGEAMAIGRTFKESLQKCLRSFQIGRSGLGGDGKPWRIGTEIYGDRDVLPRDVISRKLSEPNAGRICFDCAANTEAAFRPGRSPGNQCRATTIPFALGVCSPIRRMAGCEILRAPYSLR